MRIAVIGANGYVGKHLVKLLLSQGAQVNAYGINKQSVMESHPMLNYTQFDITNKDSVAQLPQDLNFIFLMAGITGTAVSFDEYEKFIDINEKGLLNILDFVRTSTGSPRIVFPSTRLVYKGQEDIPLIEDSVLECKTVYALNKYSCENYLKLYSSYYGVDYTIARICVPYGNEFEGDQSYGTLGFFMSKVINDEAITLFGDGSVKRTFTHIFDICNQIVEAAKSDSCKNQILNIYGESYSLFNVAQMFSKFHHSAIAHVKWPELALKMESGDTIFDGTKIKGLIIYRNQIKIESWIKELTIK